jgi:hypothetical protein
MRRLLLLSLLLPAFAAPAAEVHGRVVKVEKERLYLQERDTIIALELTPQTTVSGAGQLARGAEVRASFTLDSTENLARRVEVLSSPPPTQGTMNLRTPALVPDEGETKGPGSPLP